MPENTPKKGRGGGRANTTSQNLTFDLSSKGPPRYTIYQWDDPQKILYRTWKDSSLRLVVEEALAAKKALNYANLVNSYLYGFTCPPTPNDLNYVKFDYSNMAMARFTLTDFRGASFRGVNLRGAKFKGCKFSYADLEGADISGAIFGECVFEGANLKKVIAKKAKFYKCVFKNCLGEMDLGKMSHLQKTEQS